MNFAICQELFVDWDWSDQCKFIAEVGYTGVEVAPFTLASRVTDLTQAKRNDLRETAESNGLQIIGLHWLLAKTEGLHLTASDSAVRRRTAEYLIELGNACADLGGRILVFGSPKQRSLEPGMTREQAKDNAAGVLRDCLGPLADRDVVLCLEPLSPQETDFINTCADAVELIEMVGKPNLRLHQDVKAMLSEAEPVPMLIEQYAEYVAHFHANDSNLLGPGMGEADFGPIFGALLDVGYDDWVSVEVFDYAPGCELIARESLRYMRDTLARLAAQ